MKPAMTPQQKLLTEDTRSSFTAYKDLVYSNGSMAAFLYYEVATILLSNIPAGLGLATRSVFFRPFFVSVGKRPLFGRGLIIRNPGNISLGNKVVIDDYATLDARSNASIRVGDYVSIGRFSSLVAKESNLVIGDGVNIGSFCRIATQSSLEIGKSTLIAAYCYIGPGNHKFGDEKIPLIEKEMDLKGGVKIGSKCWIGARATILDGVTIGDESIVGAHSLVLEDVPPKSVVAGSPARIIKKL